MKIALILAGIVVAIIVGFVWYCVGPGSMLQP